MSRLIHTEFVRRKFALVLTLAIVLLSFETRAQKVVDIHYGRIPVGYETYTLFLFCDHAWEKANRKDDIREIYIDFLNVADSIGKENLTVWFRKNKVRLDVDVKKGQDYCTALDLDPNDSPYLLVTSFYPILRDDFLSLELQAQKIWDQYYSAYEAQLLLRLEESIDYAESILSTYKKRDGQWSESLASLHVRIAKLEDLRMLLRKHMINESDLIKELQNIANIVEETSKVNLRRLLGDIKRYLDKLAKVSLSLRRDNIQRAPGRERRYELRRLRDDVLKLPIKVGGYFIEKMAGIEVFRTLEQVLDTEQPASAIMFYLSVIEAMYIHIGYEEYYAVGLGQLHPEYIVKVLNKLEQNIRRGRNFDRGIEYEKLKQVFRSLVREYGTEPVEFFIKEVVVPLVKKK